MIDYGYGDWYLVALNVLIFGLFALFIPFKRRLYRLPSSVYVAFVVALYAEMYGFPLTIYVLSWLFGYQNPMTHVAGHIFASVVGGGCVLGHLRMAGNLFSTTRVGDDGLVRLHAPSTILRFPSYHCGYAGS